MATIGVIFDFDDTLLPDSTTQLLKKYGVDPNKFWKEDVKRLVIEGYDPSTAYLKLLLEKIGEGKPLGNLTRKDLLEFGKEIDGTFFPGIEELILDLKQIIRQWERIDIEFYIISGGLLDIIEGTMLVPKYFSCAYGAQLAGDTEDGVLKYIKRSISFTEKTRYIFEINKGIRREESRKNPYLVNKYVAKEDRRIQICDMIYVGDGLTDIPCFSLLLTQKPQGFPFGVFDPKDAESAKRALIDFLRPNRVISMHAPHFGKDDELGALLKTAVATIGSRIILTEQLASSIS